MVLASVVAKNHRELEPPDGMQGIPGIGELRLDEFDVQGEAPKVPELHAPAASSCHKLVHYVSFSRVHQDVVAEQSALRLERDPVLVQHPERIGHEIVAHPGATCRRSRIVHPWDHYFYRVERLVMWCVLIHDPIHISEELRTCQFSNTRERCVRVRPCVVELHVRPIVPQELSVAEQPTDDVVVLDLGHDHPHHRGGVVGRKIEEGFPSSPVVCEGDAGMISVPRCVVEDPRREQKLRVVHLHGVVIPPIFVDEGL
mmetsp:Transcript_111862/g.316017  ORF Transcript_111862/g.316017 Transcript_111862/m.316017 type:complete len:257 (-) Transcript_111862:98-868(-)